MKMINGVSMIPFGLLAGFADQNEIRIIELAENGFRFRTAKDSETLTGKIKCFRICFYDDEISDYREILLREYQVEKPEEEKFYFTYSVFTKQEDFRKEVQGLLRRYTRYIHLKTEEDDAALAEALTGYPAEKDEIFAKNLTEQKNIWFQDVPETKLAEVLCEAQEFALELDRPELYRMYLEENIQDFMKHYWEQTFFAFSGEIQECVPDRLYIGNQFCHLLFPEEKTLKFLLDKAYREGLAITIVYTYVRENLLKNTEKMLHMVDNWCEEKQKDVEIVVNDWAVLSMVKKTPHLKLCMGTLLNKRKKDPRMKYKKGAREFYSENSLNADFYRDFLREKCGFQRFEWESCGYHQRFPKGKNSLHFPFYQTNTSQYCPLHAICTEGERGKQSFVENCPHFCEKYTLTYPEHLHMIGRYNSLFGLDLETLMHPEILKEKEEAGIDRLVLGVI